MFKKEISDGKMFDVIYKMDDNDICECEIEIFRNHNNVNMAFILGINKKTFAKFTKVESQSLIHSVV